MSSGSPGSRRGPPWPGLSERFGIPEGWSPPTSSLKRRWQEDPPGDGRARAVMDRRRAGWLNLVVTHRDRTSATSLLEQLGLVPADLVCPGDGFRKPDPTMHRLLVERHGLDPAECLGVGDRALDAEAARAAGMAAVLGAADVDLAGPRSTGSRSLTDLLGLLDAGTR